MGLVGSKKAGEEGSRVLEGKVGGRKAGVTGRSRIVAK